jgi:beta-glucanase (GH16 family)
MLPSRARRAALHVALGAVLGACLMIALPDASGSAAAASSWKTVRTETFSGSALPEGCGTYGGKYVGGESYWMKDDVAVKDGQLQLRLRDRTVKGHSWTSGGVGCWDWAQTYGRYEVRAKVPAGKGIDSYVTLWPTKGGAGAWTGIELLAPGPDTAYVTNGYGSGTDSARIPGSFSDRFRTYVIEWAPNLTRISVDGDVIFSSTRSYKGKRWFGMVVSNGDKLTGVPDASTPLPATFRIDSVKISSFTGVPLRSRPASRDRLKPAASASASSLTTPTATVTPSPEATAQVVPAASGGRDGGLAGGVWPWLLGGSLIAVLAVLSLGYPQVARGKRSATGPADRRAATTPPASVAPASAAAAPVAPAPEAPAPEAPLPAGREAAAPPADAPTAPNGLPVSPRRAARARQPTPDRGRREP